MLRIIAGSLKNRLLRVPKGSQTRPTSNMLRESFFNICQTYIEEALFLDLYSGSGAMGIEALSRGAAKATFVDACKESIVCIRENLKLLDIENRSEIVTTPVEQALKRFVKQGRKFDLIFADPPYSTKLTKSKNNKAESLLVIQFLNENQLLESQGRFFVEEGDFVLENFIPQNIEFLKIRTFGKSILLEFRALNSTYTEINQQVVIHK